MSCVIKLFYVVHCVRRLIQTSWRKWGTEYDTCPNEDGQSTDDESSTHNDDGNLPGFHLKGTAATVRWACATILTILRLTDIIATVRLRLHLCGQESSFKGWAEQ